MEFDYANIVRLNYANTANIVRLNYAQWKNESPILSGLSAKKPGLRNRSRGVAAISSGVGVYFFHFRWSRSRSIFFQEPICFNI